MLPTRHNNNNMSSAIKFTPITKSRFSELGPTTYLRSPSTSERSFVMAITSANNVTKVVMKATGDLQAEIDVNVRVVIQIVNFKTMPN